MVNLSDNHIDALFTALADPTRRGMLAALAVRRRSVSELAEPFGMSLPGALKHVRSLEKAGLVTCEKSGRTRFCSLRPQSLKDVRDWVDHYQRFWERRLDALEKHLKEND